jgi:hypothetical protein
MLKILQIKIHANKKTCGKCRYLERSFQLVYGPRCYLFNQNLRQARDKECRCPACLLAEKLLIMSLKPNAPVQPPARKEPE